ncbi:MAG: DUF4157 domain-containing protein [Saprospiraceae bacterium]
MKSSSEKSTVTSSTTSTPAVADRPFFEKADGGNFFGPVNKTSTPSVQMKLTVNQPGDKFEQEADQMANRVLQEPTPLVKNDKMLPASSGSKIQKKALNEEKVQKAEMKDDKVQKAEMKDDKVQKKESGGTNGMSAQTQSAIQNKTTGGQPLSNDARSYMEPRLGADFSNVRVHSDTDSAGLSNQLSARAFTYQNHVFFSRDQYQPGTSEGKQLLAHELTHTIQQGHSPQQSTAVSTTSSTPQVQRLGMQDALDYFADKAYHIPGFRLLTILLGFNPINMRSVDRNAANLLRGLIELIPGGHFITQALDNHGVINKAAAWIEQKITILGDIGGDIVAGLKKFIDSLSWTDIFDLGGVWDRAKRIFTDPIVRLIDFGKTAVLEILKMVKDAILKPLAALAQGTRGYDLLKAVLGEDPITGEPVPRNADTLIGGFMKLIGQEEVWENIKKGNAIARAWVWFQGALSGLMGMVRAIPGKIINTLKSLTFQDIITVVGALGKIIGAFVNIAVDFISWGLKQVISLLEIIFSVVAPGAVPYIKKAQGAFEKIIKNPIGFVGNLVRAGKLGFQKFADNILTHLKTALIKWITGPLGDAGVYIPKEFSLIEIIKLVLSVLGLTWQNIRSKLVKIIPEPVLVVIEKTASVLVTLVKDGPVAAWQEIKSELTELKDQMIAKITEMVTTEIVKAAVMKLVSMLNPAGAIIQAIIAIYNTITFFIEKINQIAAVVASFIDSVSEIASGAIENAAKKVEQTMANTLVIIIGFLAKFAGLGGIPNKLVGIIKKIRAPIDKGLDKIVGWLGGMLKKLTSSVAQAGLPTDPAERFKQGLDLAEKSVNKFAGKKVGKFVLAPLLIGIKTRYGFQVLDVFISGNNWWIDAVLNPSAKKKTYVEVENTNATGLQKTMPVMTINFYVKSSIQQAIDKNNVSLWTHYVEQLQLQENRLRQMAIQTWFSNIDNFYGNKTLKIKAKGRSTAGDSKSKQLRDQLINQKAAEFATSDPTLSTDQARKKAQGFWSEEAILHVLDQGGGGEGTELVGDLIDGGASLEAYLGNARVDYSIGAKWPARVRVLKSEIEKNVDSAVFGTEKMNVTLKAIKQ